MSDTKEGDLKVWWVPQVPGEAFEVPVPSVEAGAILLNVLAEYDAFQYINGVKPDYSNAGGLQEFDGTEWLDWEDLDSFEQDPSENFPQPYLGWCSKL